MKNVTTFHPTVLEDRFYQCVDPPNVEATLKVVLGGDTSKEFKITTGTVIIGRNAGDIPIDDQEVSRQHAQINFLKKMIYLQDLGSTNGTFHNNRKTVLHNSRRFFYRNWSFHSSYKSKIIKDYLSLLFTIFAKACSSSGVLPSEKKILIFSNASLCQNNRWIIIIQSHQQVGYTTGSPISPIATI